MLQLHGPCGQKKQYCGTVIGCGWKQVRSINFIACVRTLYHPGGIAMSRRAVNNLQWNNWITCGWHLSFKNSKSYVACSANGVQNIVKWVPGVPGRTKQNSQARAETYFTNPDTSHFRAHSSESKAQIHATSESNQGGSNKTVPQ